MTPSAMARLHSGLDTASLTSRRTATPSTANPPYAISAVLQPNVGVGTNILYGIPVPYNPEFKATLNPQGGVVSLPGTPPIRLNPWVVNPNYKTQYSGSWFFNVDRELRPGWIVELGYVGTNGVNLERN
jgi:hypothetical protein